MNGNTKVLERKGEDHNHNKFNSH